MLSSIPIDEYQYDLPLDRIAAYPLPNRDDSKLLVYNNGKITHSQFKSLANFVPPNSMLFFNNTRVIPARLHFYKETGAAIEVFLLNPAKPSGLLIEAMNAKGSCSWYCTIGNLKRWKDNTTLSKSFDTISLTAELSNRKEGIVDFSWAPKDLSFAEVISKTGVAPLPPYIKREAGPEDIIRYQTIYAEYQGAVAAPTAGLHFTDHVLQSLREKNIKNDFLTLHVSAGTFQPVKTSNALEHEMHSEQILVNQRNIENLLMDDAFILPVGTTSLRTLESIYWYGVKLMHNPDAAFIINQNDPYQAYPTLPTARQALKTVLDTITKRNLTELIGSTSIYVHPGYTFRLCRGLITNFHLPGSTLMLLVAALVGKDWKAIYQEAINKGYRFLSYGDSSLLLP